MVQPANLLLISYDQWRGDWGDPWNPVIALPGLKTLARDGWTARRCYTTSPHCVPARFSWLTGLAPSQMGVTRNQSVRLPADAPSIVRDLQAAGWFTALVGKTHWTSHADCRDLRDDLPLMHALGFDSVQEVAGPRALRRLRCDLTDAWEKAGLLAVQRADLEARYKAGRTPAAWDVRPSALPAHLYPDLWIAERGIEQLQRMPNDQPWLLWVSFVGPHEPFDTPAPWHGQHRADALPHPTPSPKWLAELPESSELKKLHQNWRGLLTADALANCRADYADHLKLLDDQLLRLIGALEGRADQQRTAIAVTADHGELLGDAEMLYKGAFLEGAVRVPWVYRPPAMARPTQPCDLVSMLPASLTGLLSQTLKGLRRGGDSTALAAWVSKQEGAVVEFGAERLLVQGARKLALDADGQALWAVNLRRDPEEQINVISSQPQRWRWSPHWRRMRDWSKTVHQQRSTPAWIWRQLGSHS